MKDVNNENLEQDIVSALLEASAWRKDSTTREVVIKRGEKNLFSFKVEPIDEEIWRKCRRQNLRNRGKRTEELDDARFLSQVIFEATCDEDKGRLWKNRDVWKNLNATNGIDVINLILKPGEKSKVVEVIASISGYDDGEEDLETIIKN